MLSYPRTPRGYVILLRCVMHVLARILRCGINQPLLTDRTEPSHVSIDLSKVAKLKQVTFRPKFPRAEWIDLALRTIRPDNQNLRQVSIYVDDRGSPVSVSLGANVGEVIGAELRRQWSELDRLLVELWESRSVRTKIVCIAGGE